VVPWTFLPLEVKSNCRSFVATLLWMTINSNMKFRLRVLALRWRLRPSTANPWSAVARRVALKRAVGLQGWRWADAAYSWPCISVPKMRFTETVHLLHARVFGVFEVMQGCELTRFSSMWGKAMIAEVRIPVIGAVREGMSG